MMVILQWIAARLSGILGWFGISGYSLSIGVALTAALLWWWHNTKTWLDRTHMVQLAAGASLAALVVGRTAYVWENAMYFQQNPAHVTALRTVGGLHGSAALLGATLTLLIGSKAIKASTRRVMLSAIPSLVLASIGAWRGCILAGCASGKTVLAAEGWLRWFVAEGRDLYGSVTPRFAVQNIAAFAGIITFLLTLIVRKQSLFWITLYTSGCAALTLLRATHVPVWGNLRSDTVGWLIVSVLYGILALVLASHRKDTTTSARQNNKDNNGRHTTV